MPRSVDELPTFYIFRWINNVFHILLKKWHIMWFGPNCLGKSTPSFRTYDMIKNIAKCLSHHAFIIVKMYVVNRIIWTYPPVVALLYAGAYAMCGDACNPQHPGNTAQWQNIGNRSWSSSVNAQFASVGTQSYLSELVDRLATYFGLFTLIAGILYTYCL